MSEHEQIMQRFEEDWKVFVLQARLQDKASPDQLKGLKSVFQSGYLKGAIYGSEITVATGEKMLMKAIEKVSSGE